MNNILDSGNLIKKIRDGKANLRPSTFAGYKCHIKNHIVPYIGNVPLKKLTPAMIDNMLKQLSDKGLSTSTCRYAQRILSVAFEAARKYRYIETNPARDILTKFGKDAKTPDPLYCRANAAPYGVRIG